MADYKVRMKAEQADEAEEIVDLVKNLTSEKKKVLMIMVREAALLMQYFEPASKSKSKNPDTG